MEEEEQGSLESFLKWATELGITDRPPHLPSSNSCVGQSLSVSNFPEAGGRGLAAVRDLRKGELLLRVPKSALMTTESLLKDQTLSLAVNNNPSLSSTTQILIASLLNEAGKGKGSWWYPYLLQLPRSYDILATFGQFETQALQVEEAIWAAEKAIAKAELDWKEAIALMEELKLKSQLLSFRAWVWASATISSRTMHIPWDSAGCLCPVGDFFNYAAPGEETYDTEESEIWRNASSLQGNSLQKENTIEKRDAEQVCVNSQRLIDGGYEEDVAVYCFYARRDYKKGEQVLLSYGTYTNLELLEHYGFLLNENPNDKGFIPLEPEIYASCSWPQDSLYIHQNGKPSFALLSALRLWATPPNQRRSIGHLAYSGSQLSTENEIIVIEFIAKKCHVILKSLPTSIEEDELVLCTIDKMLDFGNVTEGDNVISAIRGEVCAFFDANHLLNGVTGSKSLLSRKTMKCLNRWKLAVQWRLRYKKILDDCVSYCTETMDNIRSERDSTLRTMCPNLS